jgi:DNA-binding transcriptional LysR family regulator
LTEARKTLKQAEHAVLLAQRTSRGEIGQLAIGFTGPALNSVLPKIVRRFKERYPKVDLALERLQTNEQVQALTCGQIHAGLLHPPIDDGTLILETIHRENLVVILPDTHPLAEGAPAPISLKELASEPFILFPRRVGPVLYDQIISLCQQAGFSPHVVQEVIPQQTILGLVAVGIGITLIHASVQALGGPGVVVRRLVEPTPELELAVAWSPDATNPVLPSFVGVVREVAFQNQG